MNQAGAMLGQAADNGLVDRILIEVNLNPAIQEKLFRIEEVVDWKRDRWHGKIADFLTRTESVEPET